MKCGFWQQALDNRALQEENVYLKQQLRTNYRFDNIVGTSKRMQDVFQGGGARGRQPGYGANPG